MYACEIYACEMHAYEMHAYEMHAYEMHAHEMHAHEMHFLGYSVYPRMTRARTRISFVGKPHKTSSPSQPVRYLLG
jgi:hypothetical protein